MKDWRRTSRTMLSFGYPNAEFSPRPDCDTCEGTGTIAIDPARPKEPFNEGPCFACWFDLPNACRVHGLTIPCILCTIAMCALAERTARPMSLVPVESRFR